MKRSFMGLYFSILVVAFLLTGCAVDPEYTAWFETSAAVDSYCGGLISVPGKAGERDRYGMYINNKDNTNMDLFFVDIDSYKPGEVFVPIASKDDPNYVENYNVTKTVTEINTAIQEEEALQNFLAEVVGKISNTPVTGCEVVFTENDFCTILGDGVFACLGNIKCDKSVNIFVHYVFKGFDTESCPSSSVLLAYLKMQAVKTEKDVSEPEEEKSQKKDTTPPIIKRPDKKEDTTPKNNTKPDVRM